MSQWMDRNLEKYSDFSFFVENNNTGSWLFCMILSIIESINSSFPIQGFPPMTYTFPFSKPSVKSSKGRNPDGIPNQPSFAIFSCNPCRQSFSISSMLEHPFSLLVSFILIVYFLNYRQSVANIHVCIVASKHFHITRLVEKEIFFHKEKSDFQYHQFHLLQLPE